MGSNVPQAAAILDEARQRIASLSTEQVLFSTPVRTAPIDYPWPAMFTNQVARLTTTLSVTALETSLKAFERAAGRSKAETQRGIVRLDLDLLAIDGRVLRPSDRQRPYIRQGVEELERLLQ